VGKGKGRFRFDEEECRESVWSGYGESTVQLGEVNFFG